MRREKRQAEDERAYFAARDRLRAKRERKNSPPVVTSQRGGGSGSRFRSGAAVGFALGSK